MDKYAFSVQKLAYLLIVIVLFTYILIIGKSVLSPLIFATIFAFMLKPICGKIENFIPSRAISILLTFLVALIPIVAVITIFSMQLIEVVQNMDSIATKLEAGYNNLLVKVSEYLGMTKKESVEIINENSTEIIQAPLSFLGTTLSLSGAFLINFFLTIIYTFLLLLYRTSFKNFYYMQFGSKIKEGAELVLDRIQKVIQQYLYGLLLVVVILGVLNSIGLTVIGIQYAIFWGFLAAFLAIIPYVGAMIGGSLPFLFAFATSDTLWQPIAVVILFTVVQIIEGNIITPKVVGSSIKLNPLAAILALIVGGSIWGVPGLILALPIMAIIRIIINQIDFLKPVGVLLGDQISDKEDVFGEKFDDEKFRIFNFFKKKKTS